MGIFDKFHPGLGGGALTGGGGYRSRPKPSAKKKTQKEIKQSETSVGGTGSKKMPTAKQIKKIKSQKGTQVGDPKAAPSKIHGEWKRGWGEVKESVNPVAKKHAGPGKQKRYTKPTVSGARTKAQEATRTAPKPKTGSRIPMKPKTAIAKALAATSEAGQRAIKAGTKSRKTYGGTYKRFKVK